MTKIEKDASGRPSFVTLEADTPYAFRVPIAWALSQQGTLVVPKCPFCSRQHEHSPGEGTRSAHCGSAEYYVRLVNNLEGEFWPRGMTSLDVA